jgi:O-antigen/teichoic acid export membrane protein
VSRSRRAAWTFALSLVATGSGVLVALITTPLLLHYLGDDRVGTYRSAVEWVGYLTLLDLGIAGSLQVALARALGTGDPAGVAASVRAGFRAGVVVAALSVVLGLGLAMAAPWLLRGLSPEVATELRFGLLISLATALLAPLIAFRPLAEASQRGFVVQIALIAQGWVTACAAVGLAAAGAGLAGQFLAAALGAAVATLIMVRDGLRRHPGILARADRSVALPVAFSGSMIAYALLSRLGLHSDAIIVGLTIGPAGVVAFTLTQRLLLLVDTQVMALGGAAWAALAELHHRGEAEQFNRRLTQLTRWTGVLVFGLIVPLVTFTRPFIGLWVGANRFGGDLLVLATAVFVWAHVIVGLWGWPLITTGRVRSVLPVYVVGIPLNVAISIAGCYWVDVAGPALGSAVSVVVVWLPWIPLLLRSHFGTPLRPLASAVLGPALIGIPLAAGLFLAAGSFAIDELAVPVWARWVVLAGVVTAAATVYFVLAWLLVLPRDDRLALRALVFPR